MRREKDTEAEEREEPKEDGKRELERRGWGRKTKRGREAGASANTDVVDLEKPLGSEGLSFACKRQRDELWSQRGG